MENPVGPLKFYNLSRRHGLGLASGDIEAVEEWVGPLDERIGIWMKARLQKQLGLRCPRLSSLEGRNLTRAVL